MGFGLGFLGKGLSLSPWELTLPKGNVSYVRHRAWHMLDLHWISVGLTGRMSHPSRHGSTGELLGGVERDSGMELAPQDRRELSIFFLPPCLLPLPPLLPPLFFLFFPLFTPLHKARGNPSINGKSLSVKPVIATQISEFVPSQDPAPSGRSSEKWTPS